MYEVPATSAFVLLFTEPDIYDGQSAKRLLRSVDLSAGEPIKNTFEELWDLGYAEIAMRKVRVKQLSHEYLCGHGSAQVVSLGGGLDPLTLDLAEMFPDTRVFDVDMSQMDIKADINQTVGGPDIAFVTANLADAGALTDTLAAHGWEPDRPTLVIAEGITYYVPAPVFAQTLVAVRTDGGALVLEYSPPDKELTDDNYREAYIYFFQQMQELLQLPFPMVRYSRAYVAALTQQLAGTLARTLTTHDGELALKGRNEMFPDPSSGLIRVSLITF